MKTHHFGGDVECDTPVKLQQLLNLKYGENKVNEFLLKGESKYPYIAIMVKDKDAVVTYFSETEDWMFQAVDSNNKLNKEETSVFYTGTSELEIEIYKEFVIPFEKAVKAAIQFFEVQRLSACLKWSKQ